MPNIVKNTTFPGLLDLLAPHSCRGCGRIGTALCDRCKKYIISQHQSCCPHCKNPYQGQYCPNCPHLPAAYVVGERSGLLDQIIQDFKYQSLRALAKPLAELLDNTLPEIPGDIIVVPLPTISHHVRNRGFDHTYLIAKHFTRLRGYNYHVAKLLLRAQNTVQVGSSQQTRFSQAAKAYLINSKIKIDPSATYLLFDDIWTTGASMLAAADQLQKTGIKNLAFALLAFSR